MAFDIVWDSVNRDLKFAPNGDIETTTSNSVISTQNGMVMLEGRAMNILHPSAGIGFNSQVQGGDEAQAAFQLSRWVSQVSADGGNASWNRVNNPPGIQFDFAASVEYNT
jgi:hypothetical protein